MTQRLVAFPSDRVVDETSTPSPLLLASPLQEMDELIAALAAGNAPDAEAVLERGQARLQAVMVHEFQRLVGEFVLEVSRPQSVRDRVSAAVVAARRLFDAQPAASVISLCADPAGFRDQCRNACDALAVLVGHLVNDAAIREGLEPLPNPEGWVREAAKQLHHEFALTQEDGVDRTVMFRQSWLALLGAGPYPPG